MAAGYHALTEKEKQTLRLIVRGHDAKSTARHLGLSVHTINERLRDARRKLEVSSSREAARILLEKEGGTPEILADKRLGEAGAAAGMTRTGAPAASRGGTRRLGWPLAGAIVMSFILAILALTVLPDTDATSAETGQSSAAAQAAESATVRAARSWLELGDQGRWNEGWAGTTADFRRLNSAASWARTSTKVRAPLGAVRARTLLTEDFVPASPAGAAVVKFRTDFAGRQGVIETVSLAQEGGVWRVVGVYLD